MRRLTEDLEREVALAIFDLDNTLLAGDSDYQWGQFLVRNGIVDQEFYERENEQYYRQYQSGTLDIHEFLRFSLRPLAENDPVQLQCWREQFIAQDIEPLILPQGEDLLERHRRAGHTLMIITATNRFVTEPIAQRLGVLHLLATEAECIKGRYTGNPLGIPCFRHGKVERLTQWLTNHEGEELSPTWFYSDSHNDLPLLEHVDYPVAVDPDEALRAMAKARGWPIISLRNHLPQSLRPTVHR